jgi:ribonuclease HII
MPNFDLEKPHLPKIVAGVDEAGRGPWAGPVVAAAVFFDDESKIPAGINDSKKLSKKKREAIFDLLTKNAKYGVGIVGAEEIDSLNILAATKLAMQKALDNLAANFNIVPQVILVDGNQKIIYKNTEIITVVQGDSKSLSIAAASIIAKVTRDNIMEKLHAEFPQYNWAKNSGYGTADHIKALAENGITEHHRKSYAPIKKLIG